MAIFDIFSKRTNKGNKELFIYNNVPQSFRVQVIHIWTDAIGVYRRPDPVFRQSLPANKSWEFIHNSLCREYGLFELHQRGYNWFEKCQYFLLESSVEHCLDIVEFTFKFIDKIIRDWYPTQIEDSFITISSDEAIYELNSRFREHGLGFQYINGNIVRIDSDYIYQEAVEPAVRFLYEEDFRGASDEFMSSHEHFRKERYKEAVVDALKSFESVMKTICKRMNWEVSENAPAKQLIDVCFKNGLISHSLQNQFNSLRITLESGLPTVRNKTSGHGQGELPKQLPPHVVAYALHLAATNIVFLVESYKLINN